MPILVSVQSIIGFFQAFTGGASMGFDGYRNTGVPFSGRTPGGLRR